MGATELGAPGCDCTDDGPWRPAAEPGPVADASWLPGPWPPGVPPFATEPPCTDAGDCFISELSPLRRFERDPPSVGIPLPLTPPTLVGPAELDVGVDTPSPDMN